MRTGAEEVLMRDHYAETIRLEQASRAATGGVEKIMATTKCRHRAVVTEKIFPPSDKRRALMRCKCCGTMGVHLWGDNKTLWKAVEA